MTISAWLTVALNGGSPEMIERQERGMNPYIRESLLRVDEFGYVLGVRKNAGSLLPVALAIADVSIGASL